MPLGSAVDWTNVIVVGIPSILGALFAGAALIISTLNRRNLRTGNGESIGMLVQQTRDRTEDLKTPSGDPIGQVAEETHAISHATVALVQRIDESVTPNG